MYICLKSDSWPKKVLLEQVWGKEFRKNDFWPPENGQKLGSSAKYHYIFDRKVYFGLKSAFWPNNVVLEQVLGQKIRKNIVFWPNTRFSTT